MFDKIVLEVLRMGYPSDLTDKEWELIEPIFTKSKKGKHLQKNEKRDLVNGVLYIVKTGCQWEYLPKDYPKYKTVNSFYVRAKNSGMWEEMMDMLVQKTRKKAGRNAEPSYSLIDSQSAKTTSASTERGVDGGEKGKGSQETHCDGYHGEYLESYCSCGEHTRYNCRVHDFRRSIAKISIAQRCLRRCGLSRNF